MTIRLPLLGNRFAQSIRVHGVAAVLDALAILMYIRGILRMRSTSNFVPPIWLLETVSQHTALDEDGVIYYANVRRIIQVLLFTLFSYCVSNQI